MASDSTSITRTFIELAGLQYDSAAPDGLRVRAVRVDGSSVEGPLLSVDTTTLLVEDSEHGFIRVEANELRTLDVETPRRGREWVLAGIAGIGVVAAMIGWAHLPWVRPERENDIFVGFVILSLAAVALSPVLLRRTGLGRWLTKWRPLYPPGA